MAADCDRMGQLSPEQHEAEAQQDFAGVREARDKTSCKPDSRNTTVMTPAW